MATVTEKLRFLLETDATGAVKGFRQADASMTSMGKSAGMTRQQMAGMATAAVGVGTVVVGAMVKAADKFKNLAIEAGKMADATGLSVEQASRWREVLGDMEVNADTFESSLNRLNKTISTTPKKLTELGVAVKMTATGTVDVNATFLALVDRLNAIEDPAKRAETATALLGKGWTELAEAVGVGSDALRNSLAAVSDQNAITDEERQDAREYQSAMNDLNDVIGDVSTALGQELVPALAATAQQMAAVGKFAVPVAGGIGKIIAAAQGADSPGWARFVAGMLTLGSSEVRRGVDTYIKWASTSAVDVHSGNAAASESEAVALERVFRATHDQIRAEGRARIAAHETAVAMREVGEAAVSSTSSLNAYTRAWERLTGDIDVEQALMDIEDALTDVADVASREGESMADAWRRQRREILTAKEQVLAFGKEVLGLPDDVVTSILAQVDDGDVDALLRKLQILSRNVKFGGDFVSRNAQGFGVGATGGVVTRPTMALIGEAGPEAVVPLNRMPGASPLPGGGGVTIMPGAIQIVSNGDYAYDGQRLIEAIVRAERNLGTGWRN